MKINKLFTALMALATMFATASCGNDDEGTTGAKKFNLTINATAPEGVAANELSALTVTVTGNNEKEYTAEMSAETLTATVEVAKGSYTVVVKGNYTSSISVVGSSAVDVYADAQTNVVLATQNASTLVFKEVYYVSKSYSFIDTYYEIVNNSDEVQYLDNCILGSMVVLSAPSPWVDDSGAALSSYPCYGYVLAFPGTGTTYPIQPGQSVVVANDATSHAAVDLTSAPWEAYLNDAGRYFTDTDYDAPNMDIIFSGAPSQKSFGMGAFGQTLVLARIPGTTATAFGADQTNWSTEPNTDKTTQHLMIPSKYVLDVVEAFDGTEETHYKNALAKDDAGYTTCEAWSGKVIRRKCTKVENGRAYYQDTNNSTNDFLTNLAPTPGVAPSVADAQ